MQSTLLVLDMSPHLPALFVLFISFCTWKSHLNISCGFDILIIFLANLPCNFLSPGPHTYPNSCSQLQGFPVWDIERPQAGPVFPKNNSFTEGAGNPLRPPACGTEDQKEIRTTWRMITLVVHTALPFKDCSLINKYLVRAEITKV